MTEPQLLYCGLCAEITEHMVHFKTDDSRKYKSSRCPCGNVRSAAYSVSKQAQGPQVRPPGVA